MEVWLFCDTDAVVLKISNFIWQASDETLHLVLETLQAAIKAGEVFL